MQEFRLRLFSLKLDSLPLAKRRIEERDFDDCVDRIDEFRVIRWFCLKFSINNAEGEFCITRDDFIRRLIRVGSGIDCFCRPVFECDGL